MNCNIQQTNDKLSTESSEKEVYYLSKYEYTRVCGYREEQLNSGSVPFVILTQEEYNNGDVHQIFLRELTEKKLPLKIRRTFPNGNIVEIRLDNMDLSLLTNL